MRAIETEGLTKIYRGGAVGVVDLDLRLDPGCIAGFVGPNGAGKTTTIRLLLDLLRPTRGTARVLGLHSRKDSVELRARTGFLPGDLAFHGRLTGTETLELYRRLRGDRSSPRRDELLERLALPRSDLDRRVSTYSTGMRRKLGILVALQHDPELAILDEPTTGLDPLVRRRCHEAIRAWHDGRRTLFLSSHDVLEVNALCDRVLVLRRGALVADEPMEALRERAGGVQAIEDEILSWYEQT